MTRTEREKKAAELICRRLGLTEVELGDFQDAAWRTYQVIAADLPQSERGGKHKGEYKRSEIIEIVLDASYMVSYGEAKEPKVRAMIKHGWYCKKCDGNVSATHLAADGSGRCDAHKEDAVMPNPSYEELQALLKPHFSDDWYE